MFKIRKYDTPALLLFLKFALAISGLLWFYTIFRVCWNFYRDYIESVDFFGILSIYLCLLQFLSLLMSFLNLNSFQKILLKYSWFTVLCLVSAATLMAESEEELKSLLMKVKEESEKIGLKLNI